jgi:glyoxylase-like metal-dependent hydrolase (beta-lactamase superfamily II)
MIDPARLLASAGRLYGDRMDALWGEFLAVPADSVTRLEGGERLELGERELQVAYTPGHAIHHVSYLDEATRIAFVGDTCGIRIDNDPYVLPVTPPPDIDLDSWQTSIATIRGWDPALLCPTHFGPAEPVGEHLDEHERRLAAWADRVREDVASGAEPAEAAGRFADWIRARIVAQVGPETPAYLRGGGLSDSWYGLARYWKKRERA